MSAMTQEVGSTKWLEDLQKAQTRQLVEEGFVSIDEHGSATLTEKGKQRVGNRLDKLPNGDEILIQIAVLNAHGITMDVN